jgi:hypothetical protein
MKYLYKDASFSGKYLMLGKGTLEGLAMVHSMTLA